MTNSLHTFQGWRSSLCGIPVEQRRRHMSHCRDHSEKLGVKVVITSLRSPQLRKAYPSTSRLSFTTKAMPHSGLISKPAL